MPYGVRITPRGPRLSAITPGDSAEPDPLTATARPVSVVDQAP